MDGVLRLDAMIPVQLLRVFGDKTIHISDDEYASLKELSNLVANGFWYWFLAFAMQDFRDGESGDYQLELPVFGFPEDGHALLDFIRLFAKVAETADAIPVPPR